MFLPEDFRSALQNSVTPVVPENASLAPGEAWERRKPHEIDGCNLLKETQQSDVDRPVKLGRQPEASLAWHRGNPYCEA